MPKTSHQHFSVALLSKVNNKKLTWKKNLKTSCVTLRKTTTRILITIYDLLWSWCTYPKNPNRSKTPLTLFSSLNNPRPTTQIFESFHFCLDKISFSMPWMSTSCRKIHRILFKKISNFLLTNLNQNISQ